METQFHATTICAVRKNGKPAIAGDGQVTFGEHTIMKANARKVRRLYHNQVLAGFAGSVADAFTLFEKFEAKHFQPMNVNFGILPTIVMRNENGKIIKDKKAKKMKLAERALAAIDAFKPAIGG